jgi:hypothetical protein
MSGATSTALSEPPMMATCLPLKGSGERYEEECRVDPAKVSKPWMDGIYGVEKNPEARMR